MTEKKDRKTTTRLPKVVKTQEIVIQGSDGSVTKVSNLPELPVLKPPTDSNRQNRAATSKKLKKKIRETLIDKISLDRYSKNAEEASKLAKAASLMQEVRDVADNKNPVVLLENVSGISEIKEAKAVLEESEVAWQPIPNSPQVDFLAANEDLVLYSGGRGSGKSMCLMVDPLRWCHNKNFRGLIIRRTMPELRELIGRAKELYPVLFKGAKWKEQEKLFLFPSGARIEFGYCDNEDDVERYRGQQYTWLGIDEITQFSSPIILFKLQASLRTTDPTLPISIRATTNPGGSGRGWVKEFWIDAGPPNTKITETFTNDYGTFTVTKRWIHSTVFDNPYLTDNDPAYIAKLSSLPEHIRRQQLDGDWNAVEGQGFPEFSYKHHVIEPFEIPNTWYKFRACDWGYSSMAVCLWFAVNYDGDIFIYRELKTSLVDAPTFARMVLEAEKGDTIRDGIIDGSVWDNRGSIGPSIAEQMRACRWRPADKGKGSRKAGKALIHEHLKLNEFTRIPKLRIFNTCIQLIKELSNLQTDKNDPEDVETKGVEDHAYDALRYGISTRIQNKRPQYGFTVDRTSPPPIIDPVFGA